MRSAIASSGPICGRCAKDCAAPTPTICSTAIASDWSSTELPLWRAHAGDGDAASAMERLWLHLAARPQRHRARAIRPRQSRRRRTVSAARSIELIVRAQGGEANPSMRRRLEEGPSQRDFPVLEEFFAAGATDYVAYLFDYRQGRRPLAGNRHRLFVRDRPQGRLPRRRHDAPAGDAARAFSGDEGACRPCHRLGAAWDLSRRGRRTAGPCRLDHARFGRDTLRAVIWYADIRGFTLDQRFRAGSGRCRAAQRGVRGPDRLASRARRPGAQIHRRRRCSPSSRSRSTTARRPAGTRSTPRSRRRATSTR